MTDGKKSIGATSLKRCNAVERLTRLHLLPIRLQFCLVRDAHSRINRNAVRDWMLPIVISPEKLNLPC